mmetsp:Transcript_39787/g.118056  ORF Transcript_39787/g.118056 Transcript_39787/m.118056 type:complete len:634 (-) Transcript_39787:4144-6045(-)
MDLLRAARGNGACLRRNAERRIRHTDVALAGPRSRDRPRKVHRDGARVGEREGEGASLKHHRWLEVDRARLALQPSVRAPRRRKHLGPRRHVIALAIRERLIRWLRVHLDDPVSLRGTCSLLAALRRLAVRAFRWLHLRLVSVLVRRGWRRHRLALVLRVGVPRSNTLVLCPYRSRSLCRHGLIALPETVLCVREPLRRRHRVVPVGGRLSLCVADLGQLEGNFGRIVLERLRGEEGRHYLLGRAGEEMAHARCEGQPRQALPLESVRRRRVVVEREVYGLGEANPDVRIVERISLGVAVHQAFDRHVLDERLAAELDLRRIKRVVDHREGECALKVARLGGLKGDLHHPDLIGRKRHWLLDRFAQKLAVRLHGQRKASGQDACVVQPHLPPNSAPNHHTSKLELRLSLSWRGRWDARDDVRQGPLAKEVHCEEPCGGVCAVLDLRLKHSGVRRHRVRIEEERDVPVLVRWDDAPLGLHLKCERRPLRGLLPPGPQVDGARHAKGVDDLEPLRQLVPNHVRAEAKDALLLAKHVLREAGRAKIAATLHGLLLKDAGVVVRCDAGDTRLAEQLVLQPLRVLLGASVRHVDDKRGGARLRLRAGHKLGCDYRHASRRDHSACGGDGEATKGELSP